VVVEGVGQNGNLKFSNLQKNYPMTNLNC